MNTENAISSFDVEDLLKLGFTACTLEMHTTTFTKKIQFSEIGAEDSLDRKVISSGAKLVIGQEVPKSFKAPIALANGIMESECIKLGKRIWLIPNNKLERISSTLLECERLVRGKKFALKGVYSEMVEQHAQACDLNPDLPEDFGDLVRQQHFPWEYVDSQIQFKFKANVDVEKELASDFLDTVAKEAKEHLEQILETARENKARPKITAKNVNRLSAFRERMVSILLLEPKAQYVIDVIDDFLKITSPPYDQKKDVPSLIALLHFMANKELFLEMKSYDRDDKAFSLGQLESKLSSNVVINLD